MHSMLSGLMLLAWVFVAVRGQPDGWKMTDRFYGFRYQLGGDAATVEKVQKLADDSGCFGWIQNPRDNVYVGEARCAKERGVTLENQIKALHQGPPAQSVVKVYSDTKIRLHFSHFKVLEKDRDTCFLDEPHKCSDLGGGDSAGAGGSDSPRNDL